MRCQMAKIHVDIRLKNIFGSFCVWNVKCENDKLQTNTFSTDRLKIDPFSDKLYKNSRDAD